MERPLPVTKLGSAACSRDFCDLQAGATRPRLGFAQAFVNQREALARRYRNVLVTFYPALDRLP
jgi:hypothetical protein